MNGTPNETIRVYALDFVLIVAFAIRLPGNSAAGQAYSYAANVAVKKNVIASCHSIVILINAFARECFIEQ